LIHRFLWLISNMVQECLWFWINSTSYMCFTVTLEQWNKPKKYENRLLKVWYSDVMQIELYKIARILQLSSHTCCHISGADLIIMSQVCISGLGNLPVRNLSVLKDCTSIQKLKTVAFKIYDRFLLIFLIYQFSTFPPFWTFYISSNLLLQFTVKWWF